MSRSAQYCSYRVFRPQSMLERICYSLRLRSRLGRRKSGSRVVFEITPDQGLSSLRKFPRWNQDFPDMLHALQSDTLATCSTCLIGGPLLEGQGCGLEC
jgi:hypothetical protein